MAIEAWKPGMPKTKPTEYPSRIDFRVDGDGSVSILEFWKVNQEDGTVREIALIGFRPIKYGYTIDDAIAWLREHGYTVREFPLDVDGYSVRRGYRAWLGKARPIRTTNQIKRAREFAESAVRSWMNQHPSQPVHSLGQLDFAFDR